ncbi:hypothetical protein ACUL41_06265 [Virgibacillus natechei]|uniref:hypothetical protein n=1 Tax=Virgibacillus sp. CBA3643 TaxID=2942278 RepID=UPI0035A371E3
MTKGKPNVARLAIAQIIIIMFLITDLVLLFNKESIISKSLAAGSFLIFAVMLVISFRVSRK